VAAARRLHDSGIDCLLIEARNRLGGRAWTVPGPDGSALDLGCGWLHSADRNPWVTIAETQGLTVDRTPPPWARASLGFAPGEQDDYHRAMQAFYARVSRLARADADVAVAAAFEPGDRWNALIAAVVTFISGAEAARISARDFDNYQNTEVNWRVVEGYGAAIAAHGAGVPAALDCPGSRIAHGGKRLKIETAKGVVTSEQAIVTLPTTVLAESESLFAPALPEKLGAARNLPLGHDDKLFIALDKPEEFAPNSRLFAHKDRSRTAAYHFRPFGRPMIECFFGGDNARALEAAGEDAFFDFAIGELTGLLGGDFAKRLKPIRIHLWGADPFARGAYSYALPDQAGARAVLAAPVDGRLFFAGEACSKGDFSTAHGGYLTGMAAAEQVMKVRRGKS
ncbi:MAG: FAD-dependent oxidoreductase, partial [Pseudolabrys sp.]